MSISLKLKNYLNEKRTEINYTFLNNIYNLQACALVFKVQSIQHKTINDLKISPNGYSGRAIVQ